MISGKKILMINRFGRMIGGIERYMLDMTDMLKEDGCKVEGCFLEDSTPSSEFQEKFDSIHLLSHSGNFKTLLESIKQSGFEVAVIHKLMEPEQLEAVISIFPSTVIIFHDHDYYCMRHHKYFPYKRTNCPYPFHYIRCSICSGMVEKNGGNFPPVKFNSPFQYSRRLKVMKKAACFIVLIRIYEEKSS